MKAGGLGGIEADRLLREKYNIQVELSDFNNIAAITTVADGSEVYERFLEGIFALWELAKNKDKEKIFIRLPKDLPKGEISPFEAIYKDTEIIDFRESAGFISAEMLMPYPPGIPIIMPGERINKDIIDYLLLCKETGVIISGVSDPDLNKIKIIK